MPGSSVSNVAGCDKFAQIRAAGIIADHRHPIGLGWSFWDINAGPQEDSRGRTWESHTTTDGIYGILRWNDPHSGSAFSTLQLTMDISGGVVYEMVQKSDSDHVGVLRERCTLNRQSDTQAVLGAYRDTVAYVRAQECAAGVNARAAVRCVSKTVAEVRQVTAKDGAHVLAWLLLLGSAISSEVLEMNLECVNPTGGPERSDGGITEDFCNTVRALAARIRATHHRPSEGEIFTPRVSDQFTTRLRLVVTDDTCATIMADNPGRLSRPVS